MSNFASSESETLVRDVRDFRDFRAVRPLRRRRARRRASWSCSNAAARAASSKCTSACRVITTSAVAKRGPGEVRAQLSVFTPPQCMPTAAVVHSDAAVVRPYTLGPGESPDPEAPNLLRQDGSPGAEEAYSGDHPRGDARGVVVEGPGDERRFFDPRGLTGTANALQEASGEQARPERDEDVRAQRPAAARVDCRAPRAHEEHAEVGEILCAPMTPSATATRHFTANARTR